MGSMAMVLLRGRVTAFRLGESVSRSSFSGRKHLSVKAASLEPTDVPKLAHTARITLSPQEVEDFAPKIQQVVDWFGQLQAIDLESVEPSIRADTSSIVFSYHCCICVPDTQGYNLREDLPEVFENSQAIVEGIPSYEEPYIKVPKVLNKE